MKTTIKKLLLGLGLIVLVGGSCLNGYWLKSSYAAYKNGVAGSSLPKASVVPKTTITSAKAKALDAGRLGQLADKGSYAYEEMDHSKVNAADSQGRLLLASNHDQNASFVLAGGANLDLPAGSLNPDWTAQVVDADSIWQPASCASKPTYLIGGRYIFIDDGKTKVSDAYNSYVVFDMVTQKFRYFGGDSFTADQGKKEHILSVQNENDTIVFYIDHADNSGPLAGSTSFKHAASYASKYITRRVVDLSTMHFQDYRIPYQLPSGVNYYFIDAGDNFTAGHVATLSPDSGSSDGYYAGTVADNQLTFTFSSFDDMTKAATLSLKDDPAEADALDQALSAAMPTFVQNFDASAANQKHRFFTTSLGTSGSVQFMVAQQSWAPNGQVYSNPAIYDSSKHTVSVLTAKPVLVNDAGGNFVPLGVF